MSEGMCWEQIFLSFPKALPGLVFVEATQKNMITFYGYYVSAFFVWSTLTEWTEAEKDKGSCLWSTHNEVTA